MALTIVGLQGNAFTITEDERILLDLNKWSEHSIYFLGQL